MQQVDVEPHKRIAQAAVFLSTTPLLQRPKPLIPALKAMSAAESCEGIRQSRLIHARAA
jgi:hypothetical protein